MGEFLHLVREDYAKAASVFDFACKQYKYFKSCNSLGAFQFEGRGTKRDVRNALLSFETACESGSAEGCYHVGQMLLGKDAQLVAEGIQPAPAKAMTALEKGCDLGLASSCFEAGAAYLGGEKLGVPLQPEKAFKLMQLACDNFAPHFEACNNLMLMHRRGIGTAKDPVAADQVQEKLDDYLTMLQKKRFMEMQQGT